MTHESMNVVKFCEVGLGFRELGSCAAFFYIEFNISSEYEHSYSKLKGYVRDGNSNY